MAKAAKVLVAGWAALVLAVSVLLVIPAAGAATSLKAAGLTLEYRSNPMGIDVERPRLGWRMVSDQRGETQSAYRVLVASSPDGLVPGGADVWDSGKVMSDQSVHVRYEGPPLQSRARYFWTVQVWDDDGEASGWAGPVWWEMGLLEKDDWQAKWIHQDNQQATPINNTEQSYPAKLETGATLGQTFTIDGEFTNASGRFPAWGSSNSDATLTLRRTGPDGAVVAQERLTDHPDNEWGSIELDEPQPAGTYYLELSDPNGDIGWWSHSNDTLDGGTAYADGSPVSGDRTLRVEVPDTPDPLFRRNFDVAKSVTRARLYATALGVYELRMNGERVGKSHLAPGWTDYRKRVQYQTYDVTDLVQQGDNVVAAMLGAGWYAGHVAIFGPNQYGSTPHLLAQLELTYEDGTTEVVSTDDTWLGSSGPIEASDLLMGESYDARREQAGWDAPGFDAQEWTPADTGLTGHKGELGDLVAQNGPTVQVMQEIEPLEMTEPEPGKFVFDLGQNIVGNVRLRVEGQAGTTVRLRHAEVLNEDGTLYTDNLRSAKATDHYTLSGDGVETYEPRFTFHGFRYVEVSGYPGKPDLDAVTGRVLRSAAPVTAELKTSNQMVNQLVENIVWGQRGNFLSIPTDTPARDERMGWTGDINVFVGAAAYNMQVDPFLTKWLQDLRDAQLDNGAFTDVAPRVGFLGGGAAGWGDAGVTVPWTLWKQYGDTRIIEDSYPSMTRWIDYLVEHSDGYIRPAEGYGDWLNVNDETPKDLIGTAYFAYSTRLVAEMAAAIGRTADAERYEALAADVTRAFRDAYVLQGGRVKGESQTAYVLALGFDLLPKNVRAAATGHLVDLIEGRDWHLSTGFLGTPDLLPVLSANDELDVAYRLLLQDTYPSWGYQIDRGATTMWEHWDSIKPDGSFQNPAMNSFNHYAYGAVGEWMYRNIAGISSDSSDGHGTGFKKITIRPRPGGRIQHASASYQSVYGEIATSWRRQDHRFELDVTVPANTTATVHVPAVNAHAVTETGKRAAEAEGVRFLRMDDGAAVFAIGSGSFEFVSDDIRGHLAAAGLDAESLQKQLNNEIEAGEVNQSAAEDLQEEVSALVGATERALQQYVAGRERPAIESTASAQARTARLMQQVAQYGDSGAISKPAQRRLHEWLEKIETALSAASSALHGVDVSLIVPAAVRPGETVRIAANVVNDGDTVLHDIEFVMQLPVGWSATTVSDAADVLRPGESTKARIDVAVPPDQPLAEDLTLTGETRYERGQAAVTVPVRAIVDVVSPIDIVAVEANPRVLDAPGDVSELRVTLRNEIDSPVDGTVKVAVPEDWAVDPEMTSYRVSGGAETTITAEVTSPSDQTAPAADVAITATYGDLVGATTTVRITSALASWNFETDGDAEGWQPSNHLTEFVVADGFLETRSTGGDPYMIYGNPLALAIPDGASLEIRMATSASGTGQVFWGTKDQPFFSEGKSARFPVETGEYTYVVPVPPQSSPLTMLRLDPLAGEAEIKIASIRVVK
jgi:alpha-L-rhamnosidase